MSARQPAESPPTLPLILRLGAGVAPLLSPAMLHPPGPLPQCPSCWSANVALHSRLAGLGYIGLGLIAFLAGFVVFMLSYLFGFTYLGDLVWLALIALPMVLYLVDRRSAAGRIWSDRGLHCFNCGHQWLQVPGSPQPRRLDTTLPREVNDHLRQIERHRPDEPPGD